MIQSYGPYGRDFQQKKVRKTEKPIRCENPVQTKQQKKVFDDALSMILCKEVQSEIKQRSLSAVRVFHFIFSIELFSERFSTTFT
jgi:hypothetical protein